jgi:hypothetical protein
LKGHPFIEIITGVGNLDHFPFLNSVGDILYWLVAKKAVMRSIEIKYHFEKIHLCSCKLAHPGIAAGNAYSFVKAKQVKITMAHGPFNPLEPPGAGFQQIEFSALKTDISIVMDVEIAHFVEIVFNVSVVIL